MCIIVDACCANDLGNKDLPQGKLILDWIKGGGKIVSGGRLEDELKGTRLQSLLASWSSAGRLISINSAKVQAEIEQLDLTALRSNDAHVVALARLTGAQVVVTRDKPLMTDLKRSNQISTRKIYPFPSEAAANLRVQRGVLNNAGCK